MSERILVRPDMLAIVNQPYGRQTSYPITASDIRKWALAVHYPESPPARYLDPRAAEGGRLAASPEFNPFAWGAARTEHTGKEIPLDPAQRNVGAMEHLLGVVPPDLRHALNGGISTAYAGVPMRPGDVITAESVIARYTVKQGRLGPMLLTETATTWTNQRNETVKVHRMTLIRY
ncbi:MaoC family dehydratase N-terminal domain-containing protein [Streptomyces sp. NPDC097610]|uniref:FAS1-like dehydratase domain-containing protein n=1 Tax=Streptomyces sp. NPDC097610 TaxID=3157227 RepID=UPI003326176F